MNLQKFFLYSMTALVATACNSQSQIDTNFLGVPTSNKITIASGNPQTAMIGTTSSLTVVVKDVNDVPVSNATVNWAISSGSGSLSQNSTVTDASGTASTMLTLGTVVGITSVTATIAGYAQGISFNVTATPGPFTFSQSSVSIASSSIASGASTTVSLTLKDSYGNTVNDNSQSVAFSFTGAGTSAGSFGGSVTASGGTYQTSFTGSTGGSAHTIQAKIGSTTFTPTTAVTVSPTVTISSAGVVNGGGTAVFNVNMNSTSALPVSFNYATQDGSGVAGTQYTASSGTGSIASGQTSTSFSVATLDDGVASENKTFSLKLNNFVNSITTSVSAVANVVTPSMRLDFTGSTAPSGVSVARTGTATYVNSSGVITAASLNTARLDYNPSTLTPNGLLIEPASTNLFLHSQTFTNPSFTTTGVSVSSVSGTTQLAPDGTASVALLTEDHSNGTHTVNLSPISWVSGTPYTFSMYFKLSSTNPNVNVVLWDPGEGVVTLASLNTPYPNYAYSYGYGGAASPLGSTFTDAGNGWYRFSLIAIGSHSSLSLVFGIFSSSQLASFQGDGVTNIYAWGGQIEPGVLPTSYIPTTTTAASRSADVVSVSSVPGYSSSEGTWGFTGIPNAVPSSGSSTLFSANGSVPANNSFSISASSVSGNPLSYSIETGGTSQASNVSVGGGVTAEASFSAGFAYSSNACLASTQNTLGTSTSSITMPSVSSLNIGLDGAGNNPYNGWVSKLYYYPERVTDYVLQALAP